MKKSLYQISREAQEIASLLEEGELTPELERALIINQNELQEKAINYAYAIKSIEDDVTAINEEIKRLQGIKTAKTNAIDRMKETICDAMLRHGIEKVTIPTLSLSFRRSESVEVDNTFSLDERYIKTEIKKSPDKIRIKQDIKDGITVAGARLIENYNLQIK